MFARFLTAKSRLLFFIALFGICVYLYTGLFHASSIALALPSDHQLNATQASDKIDKIFESPLTYLGEGNQVYAFLSEDGSHVVKFFKACPLQSYSWLDFLPKLDIVEKYRRKLEKRCQYKFDRIFKAYDIAFSHDRQHTGLSYIHLKQTSHLHLTARVKDAFGLHHHVDLDQVAFAIQKKGIPLRHLLKKEIAEGKWQLAKEHLRQVIEMYLAEYQLGIIDHDHNLMTNVGFADDLPLRIDVGKLALDESYRSNEIYLADLNKIVHQRIAKWFKRYFPEHAKEAIEFLESYLVPTSSKVSHLTRIRDTPPTNRLDRGKIP